ncbi:MAG TPA: hypothetical protein VGC85_08960, partial [Chthoniobacterales bacterium]
GTTAASLLFTSSTSNRLDGVTVNGNITLGASQIARLQNGAQINGVVTPSGGNSLLAIDESSTLNGLTVNMDAPSANSDLSIEGNNAVIFGSTTTVRGAGLVGRALITGGTNSLTNQGTISADRNGLTLSVRANSFTNQGTARSTNGGTLNFNGTYTQTAGTLDNNASTISSTNALQINGGSLTGFGNYNAAIVNNATLRPSLGSGGMNVTGNVSLLSASQLVFQIGGLAQGTQYGFVNVRGNVSLGGQLLVTFVNGFQNSVTNNNSFTVLSATTALTGAFSNIASGNRLTTSDASGSFLVTYSGSSIVLSNYAPGAATSPSSSKTVAAQNPIVDKNDSTARSGATRLPAGIIGKAANGSGNLTAATANHLRAESHDGLAPIARAQLPNSATRAVAVTHAVAVNVDDSTQLLDLLEKADMPKSAKATGHVAHASYSKDRKSNRRVVVDLANAGTRTKANPNGEADVSRTTGARRNAPVISAARAVEH